MSGVEVITEVPQTETLELVVTEKSIGSLETNISVLEEVVKKRLEDYTPDKYMGDADLAKKDKAELSKAKDKIRSARIELIGELMKPYSDFENRCKALERMIDDAYGKLDEIVKVRDNEQKEKKRKIIEQFWESKKFDLFPLEKIFNPKWLNKTYSESSILKDMDTIIERTYKDLKSIEMFNTKEDVETLKAHYLITLDIVETTRYASELQEQREVAKREAEEREEREHGQQIQKQKNELIQEAIRYEQSKGVSSLVDEAMSVASGEAPVKPQKKEFVISVKCLESDVMKLKAAMNALQIEYSVEELTF